MIATGSAQLPLAENMHYTIYVAFPMDEVLKPLLIGIAIGVFVMFNAVFIISALGRKR
jgi:hypothetical protein